MIHPQHPLLAGDLDGDLSSLKFSAPMLCSPKLDGIRTLIGGGDDKKPAALSRKFKDIPNLHIRRILREYAKVGMDGEVITFDDEGNMRNFNEVQSDVMSVDGEPRFMYYVFDYCKDWSIGACGESFRNRYELMMKVVDKLSAAAKEYVVALEHVSLTSPDSVLQYEKECIEAGYEGVMLRNIFGTYKYGRSTVREQVLLKLKQFKTEEGTVIGVYEEEENTNPQTIDATGHAKRSSHKAGKKGKGRLGGLIVKTKDGIVFNLGSGFDDEMRETLWQKDWRDYLVEENGVLVTYKHQPHGRKEKPRSPVFLGFRNEDDT